METPPTIGRSERHLLLWLGGAVVAVAGAALARWIAPHAGPHAAAWLKLAGATLVIGGLLVVALATSARARARDAADNSSPEA